MRLLHFCNILPEKLYWCGFPATFGKNSRNTLFTIHPVEIPSLRKVLMKTNLKPIALAVAGIVALAGQAFAADPVKAGKVEVVSTTPLQGIGITLDKIPANIQTVKGEEMVKQQSVSIADYMVDNLQGVAVNDVQNNPFQPDVTFRGFSASPLLGTPQGLSVYVDGVRVNEPFGDAVNWDLIPLNAISKMNLIPGTNPLFGLNTMGGAISINTKSGRTSKGGSVEASAGSWDRKTLSAEYGGLSKDGSVDYFISANTFQEDGWRDASKTDVNQIFGKVGWQNETTKIDLSFTGADNKMIGNGPIPIEMMRTLGRDAIYTSPDKTKNTLAFVNLSGSHWISDDVMFSANTYYRHSKRKTLNGDINDDFDSTEDCELSDSWEGCNGALNRSNTKQNSYGLNAQFDFNQHLLGHTNLFTIGAFYDRSKVDFNQSTQLGTMNVSRAVDGIDDDGVTPTRLTDTKLKGVTKTYSLFATDTFSFSDEWHLTGSGRYNVIRVDNKDKLVPEAGDDSLTGYHVFNRFNPAFGLNFTPSQDLTLYANYNEGSRAPTAMELGCANPAAPCKLPNAMVADPPLKQVVTKTFEGGVRGSLTKDVKWYGSAYRSTNFNDIQFMTTSVANGMGYFDNVGKTRRVGLDAGFSGVVDKFNWTAGYSFVHATFEDEFEMLSESNSAKDGDEITVKKGDRIPGIPQHQVKIRMQYAVTPDWTIGSNITGFTQRYMRGNENNNHQSGNGDDEIYDGKGKIAGYAIVNLDTRYNLGKGWSLFGKAINIFDKEYNNGGILGMTSLTSQGAFDYQSAGTAFVMPGAPRAGWVGLRWDFDGKETKGYLDRE